MKQLIYQNYGPGAAAAPGFRSPNQIQPSISGVSAGSVTAPPENSKPPSENAPVHLAQVFAFPPVSFFARPPVFIPRQLTPLEDLPPGSAGGSGAGKPFPRSFTREQPDKVPCTYCGQPTTTEPGPEQLNGDHVIPRVQGGNNSLKNFRPACRTCNLKKRGRTPEEWYNSIEHGGT
jgi:HNH endonuclease